MKHPKDDDRELKHADGTDFDADLRWVHFDYLVNKYKMERQNKYEQLGEQLDKLWHDIDEGKLDKTGSFYTHVKSVKDADPKYDGGTLPAEPN
jgi:hypothetical protein